MLKNDSALKNNRDAENWIDRVEALIATLLQLAILYVAVSAFIDQLWLTAFSGAIVFLLSFVPAIIERKLKICLPIELTLFTSVFLYASYALGEVRDFYDRIWWWDLALHGSSALVIGLIGFLAIYVFYMTYRVRIAPFYISIITFGFAVTVGTIWEIFEFLMDWFFGLNMQRSGLLDTMTDLMVNAGGALVAAMIGFYFVRNEDRLPVHRIIRNVVESRRQLD